MYWYSATLGFVSAGSKMLTSLSLSSSPNSVTVRVDKATSEFLLAPDWTLNMAICDAVNSDHWIAKEAVKQVKKRLQHRSPKVQLLALTLLEAMVKNCGEHIHFHIAERRVVNEMIKIVKKQGDLQVRNRILMLLDYWQEKSGSPGGNQSHYYWACDELRRSGVQFPRRISESATTTTSPARQPPVGLLGTPRSSSRRMEETMASQVECLSLSTMESLRNAVEVLTDMLQAVNPSDRLAVKDEVIVDLVDRCRSNQKKLVQMLTTTADEVLLAQGLELNDALQWVIAKHDALASGSPLPTNILKNESEANSSAPTLNGHSSLPASQTKILVVEEEEDDDEFAQLATRNTKPSPVPAKGVFVPTSEDIATSSTSGGASVSTLTNALVLSDPPAPVKAESSATKEQDMVDLLSIVLSTSLTTEEPPPQTPKSAPSQTCSSDSTSVQTTSNTYVAPWAKPEPQSESLFYVQTGIQPQSQPQQQPSYHTYCYGYPPPPWASTAGYLNGHIAAANHYGYSTYNETNHNTATDQSFRSYPYQVPGKLQSNGQAEIIKSTCPPPLTTLATGTSWSLQDSTSFQNPRLLGYAATVNAGPLPNQVDGALQPLQRTSSLPVGSINGEVIGRRSTSSPSSTPNGQKPFIPPYKLFEELNVFGNSEGKMKSGPYPSTSSGSSNPSQKYGSGKEVNYF